MLHVLQELAWQNQQHMETPISLAAPPVTGAQHPIVAVPALVCHCSTVLPGTAQLGPRCVGSLCRICAPPAESWAHSDSLHRPRCL